MKEEIIEITNRTGIHARPASLIVQKASEFDAEVLIINDNKEANAKSIMGIMSLGISQSTKITIRIEGSDEEQALKELKKLIEENINE
ncbi:HPr family phosphocarrier protein [Halanaerobacter jeridensis]|uniref:Phosphocarrier protein HPr n=1 Tax=Halanaerobacter jeridensis TaxID=706427 RepID=A0A939BMA8_9FIRM|nr:HPr family phosphocarrier protein [Halanaerobacter jeridensis]MBM7555965.1 phosphotransferase system HPr (HPr) family protein [Halanaerobacter jeridensis]